MAQKLIGGGPNQVPTNEMLGDMAYMDSAFYQALNIRIQPDATASGLPKNTFGAFKTGTGGRLEIWYNDNGTITKFATLDFAPVQQGGGIGQLTNKVYMGWSGASVKVTIDNTDMGEILFRRSDGITASGTTPVRGVFQTGSNGLYNGGQIEARGADVNTEATIGWHIPGRTAISVSLTTAGQIAKRNSGGTQFQLTDSNNGNIWAPAFGGWLTDYVYNTASSRADAYAQWRANDAQNNAINWAAANRAPAGVWHHGIQIVNCASGGSIGATSSGNTLILSMSNTNCQCGN
ncbi:putative side tail fiber protein [Ralstonia phage RSP15]|uniref:putative side tail fiber protein n=1 Tax=Ralstonia phage RSP15 TaxID=1785960 RepID=UPI00074D4B0D|nr:putative side tail fiber protein [Ralstonia phage RSP15]BAU40006.1 putative side tail fiber protein [Ralstonia phage RSP15]